MPVEKTDFKLNEAINDVVESLSTLAKQKGLSIDVITTAKHDFFTHSDPVRFRQILTNLLSNAIKFTDSGHIQVKLNVRCDKTGCTDHITKPVDRASLIKKISSLLSKDVRC